ncbi:hypothetical protein [Paractinoplanes durhamensis]|uniref:hypothetical protein n=1 Tax=Paractinoplanes durhamensis TaxID=113563 RepID=UPI001945059D|nr:hypothetical protein [Actinoplanes durhamensis]
MRNQPGNAQAAKAVNVYAVSIALRAGRTVDHIELPDTGGPFKWLPALHVFALSIAL